MLSLFKERPTPRRRLLIYAAVFVISLALGGLVGREWGTNFAFMAVVILEAAWWRLRFRHDGPFRLRPAHQWITSRNMFDWVAACALATLYFAGVIGSWREGGRDIAPGFLLLLLGFGVASALAEHIVEPRGGASKPPPLSF